MSILPTHVHSGQGEKGAVFPGSFPGGELPGDFPPSAPRHTRTKRKNTTLSIDTQAEDEDDNEGRFTGGPVVESPDDEGNPRSGSPAPNTKIRASTSKKHRARKQHKANRAGSTQESRSAWSRIADQFDDHDEKMVRKWNDQIDTLLVFAGLFSAVVTEFNNEAYQLLQPDPVDESKAILRHITVQLASLPAALRSGADIPQLGPPPNFQPRSADVTVATLWYSSLVCALIAASLGMLVKQWLQHYMAEDYSSPRERSRVRQLRFSGLCQWQVPAIVAFLPLLIRIALTLFLAGLIVFIHSLHSVVMWTITSLIIAWLLSYMSSLVLPSVLSSCPYKSPESLVFYFISRLFHDGTRQAIASWRAGYLSWTNHEEYAKTDPAIDARILITADQLFSDQALERDVRECCRDLNEVSVMECVSQILIRRLHITENSALAWEVMTDVNRVSTRLTRRCAEALLHILADTMERAIGVISGEGAAPPAWFGHGVQCLKFLLDCVQWPTEMPLDERLSDLVLALIRGGSGSVDSDDMSTDSLENSLFLPLGLDILRIRPSLCRANLLPVLPDLYIAVRDDIRRHDTLERKLRTLRVILSIAAHANPAVLSRDAGFSAFLLAWEETMPSLTRRISSLQPSTSFSVAHDIHVCRAKAAELGEGCVAQVLCALLEKALQDHGK